jgi:hypothetical protein
MSKVLTIDCRFPGLNHSDCVGHIYLGSIFGEPTNCQCECHEGESK